MAKKCKCPEGIPEWIVTYGDMMSLLLCFFILLAAFSEIKDEDFEEVVNSIKAALGTIEGAGDVPFDDVPLQSIISQMEEVSLYKEKIKTLSQADDPGVTGRQLTVTRVREGLQFTVGGLITFDPGSAELKPRAKKELDRVANVVKGKTNKMAIRGHAAGADLPPGTAYSSKWDLSYARARAVMEYLTAPDVGVDPRRIRVTGCGDKEPLVARVYEEDKLAVNRRVEIIVTEALMDEFDATEQQGTVSMAPSQ